MAQSRQLSLQWRTHGGARPGAGRPRGKHVPHDPRPRFRNLPVHTTLRVRKEVAFLRRPDIFAEVAGCIDAAHGARFRVVHFSVMGNHLHLIVEADDEVALGRGMQGLGVRLARALNRLANRRGSIFADHYHAHHLRSPTEVARAIAYVLGNYLHHYPETPVSDFWLDECSSEVRFDVVSPPQTWLLRIGWKRARPYGGDGG